MAEHALLSGVLQGDALFRLLVESVRDYAIFLLDPRGLVRSWNEGAQHIKGYTPDEIIGRHFSIFYPAQEIRRGKPDYELRVASEEGRYEEEGWRIRKDGTRFWAHVVITALRDPRGDLVGFAKVTRDLTVRQRAEQERLMLLVLERTARVKAEAAVEQLSAIQNVTEAALTHLTADDLLHTLLDQIAEMLAADTVAVLLLDEERQELVARAAKGIEEEVEQGVRIPLGRGFAGRVAAERQAISLDDIQKADVLNPILGQKGIVSLLGVPLLIEGRVLGVLHVGSLRARRFTQADVHLLQVIADRVALALDHTRLVEQARSAQLEVEAAEATVRARDEFLAIAAHELKTPTTSLRLATQVLLRRAARGGVDAGFLEHNLRTIDGQLTRLTRLVEQLLDAVRVQAGKVELDLIRTDLRALATAAVEQARLQAPRRELRLSAQQPVWAAVDPFRVEQVLTNMLDNAIKFSPHGGPIEVEVAEQEPNTVRLAVRDHGLGIPPRERPRLFEQFFRAHASDHRSGLGLGLYLSRQIVERHGGHIAAEFPADGGTRMVVTLPKGTAVRRA